MKNKSVLILAALAVVAIAITVMAAPVQLVGSMTTFSGTNNSTPTTINAQSIYMSSFYVANGGLPSGTNTMLMNVQVSLGDTNNFFTVGTYRPTTTNASTGSQFSIPSTNIPVYMRVQVVNTVSNSVGVVYGN